MDEQAFRPQWQFKFQAHFDKWFGLAQCLKTYHLSLYNIKKDILLTGPFAMLSTYGCLCLHLIFICHCVRKASSSTSPHYGNCHSGNCHCFPRWHNFPVYTVKNISVNLRNFFFLAAKFPEYIYFFPLNNILFP